LSCGKGGENYLETLTWRSWTATEALASGTLAESSCFPNCPAGVDGRVIKESALVVLSKPVTDSGLLLFSLVTVQPSLAGMSPFAQCLLSSCATTVPTTTLAEAPFAFVDPETLNIDLSAAWAACFGYSVVDTGQQQVFDNQFAASEEAQTKLAESGQPYFIPNPQADALAFAQAAAGGLPCTLGN
jgi:hypothetical protein